MRSSPQRKYRHTQPSENHRYDVRVFMIRPWPAEDDHYYSEEALADDETFQRVLRSADQVMSFVPGNALGGPRTPSHKGVFVSGQRYKVSVAAHTLLHAPSPPTPPGPLLRARTDGPVDPWKPGRVCSWCDCRATWPRAQPPFEDSSWTYWSSRSWAWTLSPTSCLSLDWQLCRQAQEVAHAQPCLERLVWKRIEPIMACISPLMEHSASFVAATLILTFSP